ncbi:hypothetical protein QYE76_026252 [Lolium multiflorum]|uniref:non-specific serine/threonine protein kinase n=1 Tax=Lolium multiflorum TaxID=4521 RepID=A0AAD8VXD6_LOLMU|nr:hypothetical protein QYE76_026252 [Lolium multiflorum]
MPPKRSQRRKSPPPPEVASVSGGGAAEAEAEAEEKPSRKEARARRIALRAEQKQQRLALLPDGEEAGRRRRRRGRGGWEDQDLGLGVDEEDIGLGVDQGPAAPLSQDAIQGGGTSDGEADEEGPDHAGDHGPAERVSQDALDGGGTSGGGVDVDLAGGGVHGPAAGISHEALVGGGADGGGDLWQEVLLVLSELADAFEALHIAHAPLGAGGLGLGKGAELPLCTPAEGVSPIKAQGAELPPCTPAEGVSPIKAQGAELPPCTPAEGVSPIKKPSRSRAAGQGGKEEDDPSPKRTGRKWKKRGFDAYVRRLKPEDIPREPKVKALQDFAEYEDIVRLITHNSMQQDTIDDVPFIFLSSRPTQRDLLRFIRESNDMYLKHCPFSITVKLKDGTKKEVPVTPAMTDDIEKHTHHIIVMVRESDGTEVHFLIEHFSNYLRAFRVVLKGEQKDLKPWLILGLRNVLPKKFDPYININCGTGYGALDNVTLHREKFSQIFELFLSFNVPHPEDIHLTDDEELLVWTSFICCCEILRIEVVKQWVLLGITQHQSKPLKIPFGFPGLLRDWKVLCLLVYLLITSLLEKDMLDAVPESELGDYHFLDSMKHTRDEWKDRQVTQDAIKFFFADKENVKVEWLCGEHVTLLRHNFEYCNKLLIRYLGYNGPWVNSIQAFHDKSNPSGLLNFLMGKQEDGVDELHGQAHELPAFQDDSFEQLQLCSAGFTLEDIVSEHVEKGSNLVFDSEAVEGQDQAHDLPAFQQYSFAQLHQATAGFALENIISGHGVEAPNVVYKGQINGKHLVAIKRFNISSWPDKRQFVDEAAMVGELRSVRLANMLGYCCEEDARLLVAEYMPNDTVAKYLFHREPEAMKWPMRLRVALYLAEALEYCTTKGRALYHDLNAYRVLFDSDFNPRLSCFCLMKNMLGGNTDTEYMRSEHETMNNFGILVMDLLSGKNIPRLQAVNLVRDWKFSAHRDSALLGQFSEEEGAKLVRLASECLQSEPSQLPTLTSIIEALRPLERDAEDTSSGQISLSPVALACSRKDLTLIFEMLESTGYKVDEITSNERWTNQVHDILNSKKKGDTAFHQKDFPSAIVHYSQLIDVCKMTTPTLYARRALSYLMNGMAERAEDALCDATKAQEMCPTWPATIYLLATALIFLGSESEGLEVLKYVLAQEIACARGC